MEQVLGVKRNLIENLLSKQLGFISQTNNYDFISKNLTIKDRDKAELDITFKQIIPYLIVKKEDYFLLYKRTNKQTEKRLHEKYSLGIGGHINPIDIQKSTDTILNCLKRELEEEVDINLSSVPEFYGFINDDISEVGKVHLGLLFLVSSDTDKIVVREIGKMECDWVDRDFLINNYEKLETWSQIAFDSILK